jgi:GNAT superfamily N-acetyltransferase
VLIEREGDWVVSEALQTFERALKESGHAILVHPLSKKEIWNYENDERRERAESKVATYEELRLPKYPTSHDEEFREIIPEADNFNERVDNALLYAVYSGQVDRLVSEDGGLQDKATRLGISDLVLTIEEGRTQFEEAHDEVPNPPSIRRVTAGDLDVSDPIFDSLKADYPNFESWINAHPDRDAYVNLNQNGTIGAVLILKPEVEPIGDSPPLGKEERLKICTMKVAAPRRGFKIGELLIGIAIREAKQREINEIYLTHYTKEDDFLVQLISNYGFWQASTLDNGQDLYLKRLTPGPEDDPKPQEVQARFYPTYYDGNAVDKFIVPIKPVYHSRLFPTYSKRHPKLRDFQGQFDSEGNAIEKAYLSRAQTRQLSPGDVLIFYRTTDHKEITSIGVCERVEYGVTDARDIQELVGRRSVFTDREIEEQAGDPNTVILFKWHFDLEVPITYQTLLTEEIVSGPIQTIQSIEEEGYKYIRHTGGIDERFTIN